jgi:hypothetical protein
MKACPNCRMETRADADWCWHCGFSYEEAEARGPMARGEEYTADDPGAQEATTSTRGCNCGI